jgi:hypothetical protein
MRLKFLFFPIVLVVSVALFFGFIWPEFSNISTIKSEKIAKTAELKAVKDKQTAIEAIGQKIAGDADSEAIVKNYLPQAKPEERIVNGLNYLAGDANVSLVNMTLQGSDDAAKPAIGQAGALIDPTTGLPIADNTNSVKTISASVSLSGEYDKIRMFLDNVQRMPMFNVIKSVDIQKKADEAGTENASTLLSANVDIDFGYMNASKISNQLGDKFENKLDDETIASLQKYISQKSQMVAGSVDENGKSNPFLIN